LNDIIEARAQHSAGVNVQVLGTTANNQGTSLALWWLGP